MRLGNDCPGLRTRRWEEFPDSIVESTLLLAERIRERAWGPCKGKKCKGSYSFVFPALHNRTVGKLLLDPKAPRLLVAFREDAPQALEFARRLGHPIECYSVNSKPFLMVEADPVDEADEICETMTEFLMAASQTVA